MAKPTYMSAEVESYKEQKVCYFTKVDFSGVYIFF